jgi:hypothetical protein
MRRTVPIRVRLLERLASVLTNGPLGRPEPADASAWYAVWQADVLTD